MAESDMRSRVVAALKPLHAIAVENPALVGTPDVNYTKGWLELKWARNWPKKSTTPLEVDHWTPQQKIFFIERARAGGSIFLLLQVRQEWFLLPPMWAVEFLGKATRSEIHKAALVSWLQGLNNKELLEVLRSRSTSP